MLDATKVEEVARFVTPLGSPRRFDARFFVALAPDDQEPQHDDGGIVDWEWVRPQDALDRFEAGEFTMMSPRFAWSRACRDTQCRGRHGHRPTSTRYQRLRVNDLNGSIGASGRTGYETGDLEIETGWVRLWKR